MEDYNPYLPVVQEKTGKKTEKKRLKTAKKAPFLVILSIAERFLLRIHRERCT